MKKSLKLLILSLLTASILATAVFTVFLISGRTISFDRATVEKAYSNGASAESGISVPYSSINPVKTVYVSTSGNNSNDGSSKDKSVATVKKAKDLISDYYEQGGVGDTLILLDDGEYYVSSTIEFEPEDTKGGTLHIRSINPNGATLSGSKKVSANKITEEENADLGRVWKIPCAKNINQLYVNDNYAIRARFPDAGEELRLLTWDYVLKKIILDADDVKDFDASVFSGTTIFLNLMWAESYVPVESLKMNTNGTAGLEFKAEALQLFLRENPANEDRQSYHFENSKAFLNTYGEWYYDQTESVVYYLPFPGETLENTTIRIPYTETLISVEGEIDNKVKGLSFEGLNFKYTANGHIDGKLGNQANKDDSIHKRFAGTIHDGRPISAVSLQFVENVSFSGNIFSVTGGGAIDFMEGAKTVSVTKNVFTAIGGNGVFAGAIGYDPTVLSHDERTFNDGMIVNDNYFNDIAWQEYGGCAIILNYACNSEIKFNSISNTKYSGISVGWGWRANFYPFLHSVSVENNRLTNTCTMMSDGGAIYLVGTQPNSTVKNNYISNQFNSVYKFPHHRKDGNQVMWATSGIYLDQSVGGVSTDDHVLVENNYIDVKTVDTQEYNTHNAKKGHFVITDTNSKLACGKTGVREDGFTLLPKTPVLKGFHLESKERVTVYGENLGKKWNNGLILKNADGKYVQLSAEDIVKWTDNKVTFKTENYQSCELFVYGNDGASNKLSVTMNVDEQYNMYDYFNDKWGGASGIARLLTVDKPIDKNSITTSSNLLGYEGGSIYDSYTFTGWSPDPESIYNSIDEQVKDIQDATEREQKRQELIEKAKDDGLLPHWIEFNLKSKSKAKALIIYARAGIDQADTRMNFRVIGIREYKEDGVTKREEYVLFEHNGSSPIFPAGGLLYVDIENSDYKDVVFKGFRIEKTNDDYLFVAEVAVI